MSVSTLIQLLAKLSNPTQYGLVCKTAQIATGTGWNSEWLSVGMPVAGTAPTTTASIPDNTTTGSLGQNNKAGSEQRAFMRKYGSGSAGAVVGGQFMLVDRVAHIGGLSGTTLTAQAVATPALTRFTSGVDVWAAAEIYTAIGATATTITINYTNTVPTSGQLSQPVVFGGAGFSNARRILPISMALGDIGITAIASATVLASTGTIGNFGISMFKTLGVWPYNSTWPYPTSWNPVPSRLPTPVIPDGACLQLLHFGTGQVNTALIADIGFFED